jgi:2-polyprenyl-6-methoxyphenol hydroxylase-like FAD-dependent oxidoreductase
MNNNSHRKILVTGASIAGPTLAYWLNKYGFKVTVLERAAELRLGGQNIDVKGPALEIARKMGLEEAIRKANTTEIGLRFVNTKNQTLAEFSKESALSMTQDLEILRGDFVNILYNKTKDDINYRFNDHISHLEQHEDHVTVTFNSGSSEDFELLVIAEGIGSSTRKIVFGNEPKFKFLKLYTAYFTIAKAPTDDQWARWCNAQTGIVFIMRPDNHGTTRASITFLSKKEKHIRLTLDQQKQVLTEKIKGLGWETERLIREIQKSDDLYFERVSQVKAPNWSKGSVVMIGDAAYCATPISGKGTDLSMVGAYILAAELHKNENHSAAFAEYETTMRPYVNKCQELPPGVPGLVYPTSTLGVSVLNNLFKLVGSGPVQWFISLFTGKKDSKIDIQLPDYDHEI